MAQKKADKRLSQLLSWYRSHQRALPWRMLGYYRRAEHMRHAANILVEQHEGLFPMETEGLAALPDVGPLTDVVIGCVHRNGHYLLGKQTKRKGGLWEFPGGKREKKESLRAALKREIQEEVGIKVSVRPPFHVVDIQVGSERTRLHFSRCQILQGHEKALDHVEIRWVAKKELSRYHMPSPNEAVVALLAKMR